MIAYVTTTDTCSECGAKLSNAETARLNWQAEAANAQRRIAQLEQALPEVLTFISWTPVFPLNAWFTERDKLRSKLEALTPPAQKR